MCSKLYWLELDYKEEKFQKSQDNFLLFIFESFGYKTKWLIKKRTLKLNKHHYILENKISGLQYGPFKKLSQTKHLAYLLDFGEI